jgi:CRP/FNR family cyclic AMP-dependent transcriptional regulator
MEEAVKQLTDIPAINRFLSYCRVRTVPSKTASGCRCACC